MSVSGTLIWNVADTSVSELERFCSVGSIETPGLEPASLPAFLSFTQRAALLDCCHLPREMWLQPPCPGPRWAPWCRHGAAAWAATGNWSHSWSPGPGLSPFQPAGFSFWFSHSFSDSELEPDSLYSLFYRSPNAYLPLTVPFLPTGEPNPLLYLQPLVGLALEWTNYLNLKSLPTPGPSAAKSHLID